MKNFQNSFLVIMTARLLSIAFMFISAQAFSQGTPQSRKPLPERQQQLANELEKREDTDNGIYISSVKVYDDSSLQLMLNAARAQLASVQSINQAGLLSGIGAITGGTSTQNAFSAQIQGGPPIPQISTVANGPTSQTVSGTPAVITTTEPNQSVTTTSTPPTAPVAAAPPAAVFTPPTTFSVNALGALNEQMQLTYEIANLSLLLEGSLTDRFVLGTSLVKPRTTLGFPITITPPKEYKNAVAVVEVEVEGPQRHFFSDEAPAVTALLPREKTYNVAAITNNSTSIGGGVVTQVVGGAFSWFHGRSTYYIVQDQDTIALTIPPGSHHGQEKNAAAFEWQFKPVLGQAYVQPGMRQTFVQLAVPVEAIAGCMGMVHMKTYWRRFDKKTGLPGDVIVDSIRTYDPSKIPVYDISPYIHRLDYEDLGSGQVEVRVQGQFLSGTYVRVGNNYYTQGVAGFTFEPKLIRFVAAANDLVKTDPKIVSRDGSETRILDPDGRDPELKLDSSCYPPDPLPQPDPPNAPKPAPVPPMLGGTILQPVKISTVDDSTSILTVTAFDLPPEPKIEYYLLNIANHVFGLSDAPITRDLDTRTAIATFTAIVPTTLLASARNVSVQPLFWNTKDSNTRFNYKLTAPIPDMPLESTADKITLVGTVKKTTDAGGAEGKNLVNDPPAALKPPVDQPAETTYATFMLTGNTLENAKILLPSGIDWCCPGYMAKNQGTLRFFQLKQDDWKAYKGIVIDKGDGGRPELLTLPAPPDDKSSTPTPVLAPKYRVTVGMDDAAFIGANVDKLKIKSVTFNKKPLNPPTLSSDKKSLILTGLYAAGVTTEPVTRDLVFEFQNGEKATVTLEVVNNKVETTPKN